MERRITSEDAPAGKAFQAHVPYLELLERLEEVADSGINPEVYFDTADVEEADLGDIERIRDAFRSRGLRLTMHGPYKWVSPGSPDEARRLMTMDILERTFDAAAVLRPSTIVLHGGYDEKRYAGGKALWLSQSLRTWPGFVERAVEIGTAIAVENIFERVPETLRELVEAIQSPAFGVCLDTGHLNVFSSVELEQWLIELAPYLKEVHVHDNHGSVDEHLPAGEGTFDFRLFFRLMKKYFPGQDAATPIITIEQHGPEDLERGLEAMERLFVETGFR